MTVKTSTRAKVLITGAAGGLGKAFSVECASRGYDLFLTDMNSQALPVLAQALENTYGINAEFFACDLTDHDSRTELIEYIESKNLSFRMLINIAGLDYEGPFFERTRKQIIEMLRLNIEANLEMTRVFLNNREKDCPFRVINVASLAAYYPMPVKAIYAASKRFLLDFSIALREELRPLGGTVTALCPAGMPTTPLCIRAIEAQGLAGRLTTVNVGAVAARTLDRALKGRAIFIPGRINAVLRFLGSLFPPTFTARLIGSRWASVRR